MGKSSSGYSSDLTNSYPDLKRPCMFFVAVNPRISVLTHLCLHPSGALGVSKYDGGAQTFGLAFGLTDLACDCIFVESLYLV